MNSSFPINVSLQMKFYTSSTFFLVKVLANHSQEKIKKLKKLMPKLFNVLLFP
ncbi:hypothetical protein CpecG_0243 [Chlamydia pecorum MC/MarsBar]|nr:hypothetical protein CpecS_0247 [Chlamydia pecorum VR629]ETF39144.1 hypothetical protein CpecF_0244 [Chlamydia pecorum DBDeUG]ETF39819.1 hypothetical protein CpecG_0243 [Chlamydia pecorum MC/MarsBar]ETF40870.1 hypothetical protein CpecA_0245 [Chlamydia pecorum IPTaLE]